MSVLHNTQALDRSSPDGLQLPPQHLPPILTCLLVIAADAVAGRLDAFESTVALLERGLQAALTQATDVRVQISAIVLR